jgi:hypothetical protein
MKKSILILILLLAAMLAVLLAAMLTLMLATGVSGMMGGHFVQDFSKITENKINESAPTNPDTNESVPADPQPEEAVPDVPDYTPPPSSSNAVIITDFSGSVATLNPLPDGFRHQATRTGNAHSNNVRISDPLLGYCGMYAYADSFEDSNLYFSVYKCNFTKSSEDYVQELISSHTSRLGNNSNVSTVQVNGHDAVLLTAMTQEAPYDGRYVLVWTNWSGDEYDDSYLIIFNGSVNYSALMTAADASNY